jgi:hypothetical protein
MLPSMLGRRRSLAVMSTNLSVRQGELEIWKILSLVVMSTNSECEARKIGI